MKDWNLDNSDFQPVTRTKQNCTVRPQQFAEPDSSGSLERMLKGVVPKKTQTSEQWALQGLTLVPVSGPV